MCIHSPSCRSSDLIDGLAAKIMKCSMRTVNEGTFSRSASDIVLIASGEENARWLTLMKGNIRCFEMISADILCPRKQVSHLHLKESHSSSKAKSCNEELVRQGYVDMTLMWHLLSNSLGRC